MLVNIDKVPEILIKYVDQVLVPKVQGQGSLLAFGVGASRYILPTLAQAKLTESFPVLQQLGLITEDGLLDLENIEQAARSGLKVSGKLEILGYYFDEADVTSLVQIAKEYGNE